MEYAPRDMGENAMKRLYRAEPISLAQSRHGYEPGQAA